MILIIADDLSGAAELTGIAASIGYSAEVHTELDTSSTAEVIAVDSQTRSLPAHEAAEKVESIVESAKILSPEWIYKKTDSVLRGNIRAELEALLGATGEQRVLFIPANPRKQRCIRGGEYFVNDVPLHQTVFANDPDHPQKTANVVSALRGGTMGVYSIRQTAPLPAVGIAVPDVECSNDIINRVVDVDDKTLPAGGAEFFMALLESRAAPRVSRIRDPLPKGRSLFVCGSLAAWDQDISRTADTHGVPVFTLFNKRSSRDKILSAIETNGTAMLAIGKSDAVERGSSTKLLGRLVDASASLIKQSNVHRVFLEGGATASALIKTMGWTRFDVLQLDLIGVGCLRPSGSNGTPTLFIKPGSYPWPDEIWQTIGAKA